MQILLVEDTLGDAMSIRRALADSKFGHFEVTHVRRLAEATQKIAAGMFAAVLLDLNLPDSAGLATLEELRAHVVHIPIVVLTGLSDEELAVQAVQKGAQDYLVKGKVSPEVIGRTVRYVIERARAEQAARALEADVAHLLRVNTMGQMASGLAHELNQPLSAIMNYASICLAQLDAGDRRQNTARTAVEELMNETRRAAAIIARMRGFVRRGQPRTMTIDLNQLASESLKILGFELQRREVRPKARLAPGALMVLADPIQIEQVMVNLVYNAMDAMDDLPTERRELCIESSPDDEGRFAQVSVVDSGSGVSPENLARLYEPFFTTKETGMGMGLNISRSIIESFGGRLVAAANPRRGMRFTFTVPMARAVA
jgi:C4-dicarboxylate-specific signal transduction histidine kinase